jgi:hypothetical protein
MSRVIDILTAGAALFMIGYSVAADDWRTAGITCAVVVGLVAYRRGWIRRFGR